MDEELPELDKNVRHDVSIVVDRLVMRDGIRRRLADSVETALAEGEVYWKWTSTRIATRTVPRRKERGSRECRGRRREPRYSSPRIWPVRARRLIAGDGAPHLLFQLTARGLWSL